MDGGDVEFVSLDEQGSVMVRLLGSCVRLPHVAALAQAGHREPPMSRIEGVISVDAEGLS
jgi:Fe-S cluster biogenesis protein NfuA